MVKDKEKTAIYEPLMHHTEEPVRVDLLPREVMEFLDLIEDHISVVMRTNVPLVTEAHPDGSATGYHPRYYVSVKPEEVCRFLEDMEKFSAQLPQGGPVGRIGVARVGPLILMGCRAGDFVSR